ncbi:NAD(P)-dependent oxidoreductase [Paracoccus sediminis]|uniref:3-hydroxyisobutyrate dehydrogenase n=1 Tax=Paracoccus sediminis TaxID=1214787 RepID=A0A238X2U4_9RHOB|nr:NAD(P)-dependent oxidoreductase [Paracoccus sediminis]TBN49294.1 NAD(P)-dependent oxidoreductase [Paracoccus sediminis]SNR52898.1 3-hydroxyisobutyrate dehydrogenase [Paracoccus sediminis]
MAKLAFLGMGVMGAPMAGHLKAAGHDVTVFNRTAAKAQAWADRHGGAWADTPRQAAAGAEFVMACVGNDDDLRQVCLGPEGAFAGMSPKAVFVDHTTVSAAVTRELAQTAQAAGVGYVDAPISGGQAGAENGQLSVMCGGTAEDFGRVAPVIDAYAKICRLLGDVGAGQITKMCNQIAIAGLVQALSESLAFAKKSGLDIANVVEVISQGAAGSWQMNNRHKTMDQGHFEHGFAVDWMRKDLAICLAAADEVGASLPVTALIDQFYKDVQRMGGGRWDTSSLIARLV